jgi:hypothetical protein
VQSRTIAPGAPVSELRNYAKPSPVNRVVSATGVIYIEALRAERSVAAAQANVELAQALLKLAQDQRNAVVFSRGDSEFQLTIHQRCPQPLDQLNLACVQSQSREMVGSRLF